MTIFLKTRANQPFVILYSLAHIEIIAIADTVATLLLFGQMST